MLDVRQQIACGKVDNVYVFTGEDRELINIYTNEICKVLNAKKVYLDTVKEVLNRPTTLFGGAELFIVMDDKEFIKAEKMWEELVESDKNVILIYTKIDKRSKFYKNNKVVEFTHMQPKYLVKHIQQHIEISQRGADRLSQICEDDYGRILLEVDKIKNYMNVAGCNGDTAFMRLVDEGVIYVPPYDAIFDLVDAVMRRDNKAVFRLYDNCKRVGEANMVIISVLYNTIKRVMVVQSCTDGNIEETTGLSSWDIKCAQKHVGYYDTKDLVKMLKLVRRVEKGIKMGKIAEPISVEYILVNILR